MKKNGQFPNVRVEYGFGAVCVQCNKLTFLVEIDSLGGSFCTFCILQ